MICIDILWNRSVNIFMLLFYLVKHFELHFMYENIIIEWMGNIIIKISQHLRYTEMRILDRTCQKSYSVCFSASLILDTDLK